MLRLGEGAEEFWRSGRTLSMKLAREEEPPKPKAVRGTVPVHPSLFAALRALRAKLAARQGVPAYVIFSDATLQDMCARLPSDKEEMLEVSGVGDAKFARYGEAFLKEIAAFIDANGIPF